MEKYILENYGTRGLNIVNSIKASAEKNGIENTLQKLGSFGGGLKNELEKMLKQYPEIFSQQRIAKALNEINQDSAYKTNMHINKIKENYRRLAEATFGVGRGMKQSLARLRVLWQHLETELNVTLEKIREEQEINSFIANATYGGK